MDARRSLVLLVALDCTTGPLPSPTDSLSALQSAGLAATHVAVHCTVGMLTRLESL